MPIWSRENAQKKEDHWWCNFWGGEGYQQVTQSVGLLIQVINKQMQEQLNLLS